MYGLTPVSFADDKSRRVTPPGPNASHHHNFGKPDYDSTGVNMANTSLYPGEADFRNKSTFDWANGNIRTGLFIAPVWSMTNVQIELDNHYNGTKPNLGLSYDKQIPWVARFNNSGNVSLDTDQNPNNGYRFVPGSPLPQAGLNGTQTANQMMGRGDFSSQILHYRMRGAYSVNLFHEGNGPGGEGSVEGYTSPMAKEDVRYGWYGQNYAGNTDGVIVGSSSAAVAHADNIFAQSDNKRATMTVNPIVDGTSDSGGRRSEISGTVWSGVYSLSLKQLDILVSNLDTVGHMVKFGTVDVYDVFTVKNGSGYTYADPSTLALSRNVTIEAGMHRMLQFDLITTRVYNSSTFTGSFSTKTVWLLNQNYTVFTNNNRNDVGVPEPTTFGALAAAGSMAVVCRRNRRKRNEKMEA
jgi:hypothetical protein